MQARTPLPPVQLNNRSRLKLLALKSRVAHQHPLLQSLYLKPSLDLNVVFTRHPGFWEQPVAQVLWLSVHAGSDTRQHGSPRWLTIRCPPTAPRRCRGPCRHAWRTENPFKAR